MSPVKSLNLDNLKAQALAVCKLKLPGTDEINPAALIPAISTSRTADRGGRDSRGRCCRARFRAPRPHCRFLRCSL